MKKFFFLALLATATLFTACNNDDDDNTPSEFITATIDGAAFEADIIFGEADELGGETIIFMAGTELSSSTIIGLNIPTSVTTGTTFDIDATDFALTFTDVDENSFFTVGQITLSELNTDAKVIAGTFNFTATDSMDPMNVREITGGEFRVVYD
ncbi:MAG: hypothetical protein AAF798_02220 [Bacteroidota bacterium]